MRKSFLTLLGAAALLVSCSTAEKLTRGNQYGAMYSEKPRTLLVAPPINRTSFVEAKDLLYGSIAKPLEEAGYYVISPFLAMDILRAESAYDAEAYAEGPLTKFNTYFGADAIVFSEVLSWAKVGVGINTKVRYYIKMTGNGQVVFDRTCDLFLDMSLSSDSNSGLISSLVNLAVAAVNTAFTDHIEAARVANGYIFSDIPRGPYSPDFGKDMDVAADEKDIQKTVKR